MAEKEFIKVVKADGSVHFAPNNKSVLAGINKQEGLKPAHLQAKVTLVTAEEKEAFTGRKDPSYIAPEKVGSLLNEKDAEIAALKAQLAAQGGGNTQNAAPANTGEKLSKDGNASDAIEHLKTLQTAEEVEAYTAGDIRVGVTKAKEAKLAELSANQSA